MKELIFATNNLHKLTEIRQILLPDISIRGLQESGIFEDIPEDFDTLEDNARQKARYIYDRTGMNCFADDTGLEVAALGGAPGVFSARFSRIGTPLYPDMGVTEGNIRKLLELMENKTDRKARFRTVICLILNGEERLFEGIVDGHILHEKSGKEGFGYDPLFQPEAYKVSFASMSLDEKNKISHRARAVEKLVNYLKQNYLESPR